MLSTRFASLVLLLVVALRAEAQSPDPLGALQAGARLRVDAPGLVPNHFTGSLVSRSSDTLVVRGDDRVSATLPLAAITSLETSVGRSRQRGAIQGALVTLPVSALVALIATRCEDCSGGERISIASSIVGGGAVFGATVGAMRGGERWQRLPLPSRSR